MIFRVYARLLMKITNTDYLTSFWTSFETSFTMFYSPKIVKNDSNEQFSEQNYHFSKIT